MSKKLIKPTTSKPEITTLLVDLDGVITDNIQYVAEDGSKVFKKFNVKDIGALRAIRAKGIEVIVISADDWAGGAKWCEKVGARFVYSREKEKFECNWATTMGIGDDPVWDEKFLSQCHRAYVPADAHFSLKEKYPALESKGGEGVIAELLYKELI